MTLYDGISFQFSEIITTRMCVNFPGYYVEWQGEWIHVFRPDVACTNGIIHVIDAVFLKESDVRVTGSPSVPLLPPQLTIILSVAMLLSVKWLLLC